MRVNHTYTDEEKEFIKANIRGKSYKEMTELFNNTFNVNVTVAAMQSTIKRLNCYNGINTQFKKGCVPANKGTKGLTGANKTSFKKGHIPTNANPIGHERIDQGYIVVKVQNGHHNKNYRAKHHIVWEQHNGPIPENCRIMFLDGNPLNCNIENLVLVTPDIMARLNKNHKITKDSDVNLAYVNIEKVLKAIRERKKNYEKSKRKI